MSTERCVVYQVWDKTTGERYEVGADRDGLAMAELRFVDSGGNINGFTIPDKYLAEVIECLKDYLDARCTGKEPTT